MTMATTTVSTESRGQKRKCIVQSIETKYKAIIEVEAGLKKKAQIAREFNVPSNTLSTWLKSKDKIKEAFENSSFGPKTKRMRTALYQELEQALDIWFKEIRLKDANIFGPIIKNMAETLAKLMGHTEFQCSNGWLDRFKTRHSYTFRNIVGEAHAVSNVMVETWQGTTLPNLLSNYAPEDIYNADEMGLFYKLQPAKSMVHSGEDGRGGKRSKDRLTVMPCANMTGTDKLPLLIIGKAQKPRCFKNVKTLPCTYKANKCSWMTGAIFTEWITAWDKKCSRKNRKVALVIDNCRAHPVIKSLKAVKIIFLPPNTTSITQPMDQGIIMSLKSIYTRLMIQDHMLKSIDNGVPFVWNVLDAINLLHKSWLQTKVTTIVNCFAHCGFKVTAPIAPEALDDLNLVYPQSDEEDEEEDDIPLSVLSLNLKRVGVNMSEQDIEDYITDNTPTMATMSDEDIVKSVMAEPETEQEEEEEEEEEPVKPVSSAKALEMVETLRIFMQSKVKTEDNLDMLAHLGKWIEKSSSEKKKQLTIDEMFM